MTHMDKRPIRPDWMMKRKDDRSQSPLSSGHPMISVTSWAQRKQSNRQLSRPSLSQKRQSYPDALLLIQPITVHSVAVSSFFLFFSGDYLNVMHPSLDFIQFLPQPVALFDQWFKQPRILNAQHNTLTQKEKKKMWKKNSQQWRRQKRRQELAQSTCWSPSMIADLKKKMNSESGSVKYTIFESENLYIHDRDLQYNVS